MIPAGYAEVTLEWFGAALVHQAATVFGVQNTALDLSAQQIANEVAGNLVTHDVTDRLSTGIAITNIHVKRGPDDTGTFFDLGTNILGQSPGDSNPATALLINKSSALGGRANRGRMFIPGVIEADVAQGGQVSGTAQAAFQTQWTNFLNGLAADSIPMVILHSTSLTPTPVTALQVVTLLGRQGRRLRR